MNNARRKQIASIKEKLAEFVSLRDQIAEAIQLVMDEEQEAFDNLPDSLRDGTKGDAMQEAINSLSTALDEIEGFGVESVDGSLDEAAA